ncbi:MAG: cellulase family glycosylhydrolase [Sedimentisphaerales bacterium]|nr:cellulase family glycosylhydrolase [Sedimentisphaerales bacterium]
MLTKSRRVIIVLSLAALLPVGWVLNPRVTQAQAAGSPRFLLGVCTHFSQGKGVVEMNLTNISRAGINAIRDEVPWGALEREKGRLEMPVQFDAYVRRAAAKGLNVLLILDYANRFYDDGDRPRSPEAIEGFCRYAEFVVRHFGKDVRLYEIWNEWDIGIGLPARYNQGGSAGDYAKLLKAVYPRIKAIDPNVTVIAGASTSGAVKRGWLEEVVKRGALQSCDAISIHGYNYGESFPQRGPEACAAWITNVQQMLRGYNQGEDVPFYVTEMGWPTHAGRAGTDPQLSASYLARLYLLARTSDSFKGLWWYDFQDDGWNPQYNEDNFGLVRPDLTPKPAYHVLTDISQLISKGRYAGCVATDDEHLRILRFTREGRDYWTVWSDDDRERQVILETPSPDRFIMVRPLGHDPYLSEWGYRDWTARASEFAANQLSLVVGHRPFMISGDLAGVSVVQVVPRPRRVEEARER